MPCRVTFHTIAGKTPLSPLSAKSASLCGDILKRFPISRDRQAMHTILEPQSLANTSLQGLTREMLVCLGEDPERDGLRRTPERMERSMQYLTKGYREDPEETLLGAMFGVSYDEMVVVKDIEMFSLCEHHLLPFFGKVHVAYIPRGKVIGLSKVPRLVDVFAAVASTGASHDTNC